MNYNKKILTIFLFIIAIIGGANCFASKPIAYSPKEGKELQQFIENNKELISPEDSENLKKIIEKLDKYMVISQEERDYIRECQLEIFRKKLGDAQFEEYKRLIEKRSSGTEFSQPERFRLYELEKMLKS